MGATIRIARRSTEVRQRSGAVRKVLAEAESEMRVKSIHAEVERVLGGSVSRFSVADYLRRRSKGERPLFVRTHHGHYRPL